MKKIFAIAWKDAIIRFSSKSELIFFIILPIIFTLLLAGGTANETDNRVHLLVVDQANTQLSASLIDELSQSETVRVDVLSLDKAQNRFDERRASAMLVIPAGFDLSRVEAGQANLDFHLQPNDLNAQAAQRTVQSVVQRIGSAVSIAQQSTQQAEEIRPFASAADRQAYFDQALKSAQDLMEAAPKRVKLVRGSTVDIIEYDPAANSSAGQLITWVFIPLLGISSLFAYERSQGTLRRLLTTPSSKATFLLGTISGQVVVALIQMTLLVLFGLFVMKVNWGRDPLALAVVLVSACLAAGALGTTLGTLVKTESQANGLSIMLGMVMALMGGCWYPLELFPAFIRNIVKVLPTTWAMQGMLDLVLRGKGLADILPEAGVLLGFAAIFFVIGIWRFRYE